MHQNISNIVVISNFVERNDTSRPFLIYLALKEIGCEVKVLYSIFSHSQKKIRKINIDNFIPITTPSYKGNISLKRVYSHLIFLINVLIVLRKLDYDTIYIAVPPNFTAFFISLIVRKKNVTITDFIDIWPETFPLNQLMKFFLLSTIGKLSVLMRFTLIRNSTISLSPNEYFKNQLQPRKKYSSRYINSIYLKKFTKDLKLIPKSKNLSFSYIGNIGSVYDFTSMLYILTKLSKQRIVTLDIIGDGDLKDWLLTELTARRINYKYWGELYDESSKKKILGPVWFGFNGYKSSTKVALSYKSIDYFSFGIPIINSACGDTEYFIREYQVGFNYDPADLNALVDEISNLDEGMVSKMSINCINLFEEYFSYDSLVGELKTILSIR